MSLLCFSYLLYIFNNLIILLFTVVEMNSGGYLRSLEVVREISTTFTDTEVNNNVLVYTT